MSRKLDENQFRLEVIEILKKHPEIRVPFFQYRGEEEMVSKHLIRVRLMRAVGSRFVFLESDRYSITQVGIHHVFSLAKKLNIPKTQHRSRISVVADIDHLGDLDVVDEYRYTDIFRRVMMLEHYLDAQGSKAELALLLPFLA